MDNLFILITSIFGMCSIVYALARIIRYLVQLYYDKNPTKEPWWTKALITISIILYICGLPATIIIGGIDRLIQKHLYKKELRRIKAAYKIGKIDAYMHGGTEKQKEYIELTVPEKDFLAWRKKTMKELEMDEDYLHGIR